MITAEVLSKVKKPGNFRLTFYARHFPSSLVNTGDKAMGLAAILILCPYNITLSNSPPKVEI